MYQDEDKAPVCFFSDQSYPKYSLSLLKILAADQPGPRGALQQPMGNQMTASFVHARLFFCHDGILRRQRGLEAVCRSR